MQGSGDIAAHVGTLHYTAKAVINKFKGDFHPGDIFVINDVYQGGTHFNDTRIVGPMFYKGELLGFAQANGHWADVGGAVPGSFNVSALDHMAEGLRITPVRVYHKGVYLSDVAELIANNTRAPADIIGDLAAYLQPEIEVTISMHESTPVAIELPPKATLEVVETEPTIKSQTAASSYKPAVLSNGVRTMVPSFVTAGTKIVVMTADGSYVERAKG